MIIIPLIFITLIVGAIGALASVPVLLSVLVGSLLVFGTAVAVSFLIFTVI